MFFSAIKFLLYFIEFTNSLKYKNNFFGEIKANDIYSSLNNHQNLKFNETYGPKFASLNLSDRDILQEIYTITVSLLNNVGFNVTYQIGNNIIYSPMTLMQQFNTIIPPKFMDTFTNLMHSYDNKIINDKISYILGNNTCNCEICTKLTILTNKYIPLPRAFEINAGSQNSSDNFITKNSSKNNRRMTFV
jgi:hypothetical protein